MTLNVTINTVIIKFYIELFSPFFKHFTWQLKGKIQLTIFDRSHIDCAKQFHKKICWSQSQAVKHIKVSFPQWTGLKAIQQNWDHLLSNNCSTTSSVAALPTQPNIALMTLTLNIWPWNGIAKVWPWLSFWFLIWSISYSRQEPALRQFWVGF